MEHNIFPNVIFESSSRTTKQRHRRTKSQGCGHMANSISCPSIEPGQIAREDECSLRSLRLTVSVNESTRRVSLESNPASVVPLWLDTDWMQGNEELVRGRTQRRKSWVGATKTTSRRDEVSHNCGVHRISQSCSRFPPDRR